MTQLKFEHFNGAIFTTPEQRTELTAMIMTLFDHWQLTTSEQLKLLGMSESSRALLSKYRSGTGMIPASADVIDRVGFLLAIHKNLRQLYPENPNLRYAWVKSKNSRLHHARPIDIMLEQGILGLAKIMRFLDFQLTV